MPSRKDTFDSDFVVLRYDDEEMRLVLRRRRFAPESRPGTGLKIAPTPGPGRPTRRQQPGYKPVRVKPRESEPLPSSPPLGPFAMLVTAKDSKTASALPFEGVAMQAVRKATLRTLFALPYRDLLAGTKGDAVKAVKALRERLVQEPFDTKVLNVWVDGADRVRGVDVKRLQTIVNDSKVGLSAVRIVFTRPKAR